MIKQALTGAVVKELRIKRFVLWMQFISLGGNAELESVLMNLAGVGSLPEWDRDVLSASANDLTLQPRAGPGRRVPTAMTWAAVQGKVFRCWADRTRWAGSSAVP